MKTFAVLVSLVALLFVAGCAAAPGAGGGAEVAKLAAGIRALGPEVDPEEAARAAEIAYSWSQHLAVEYEITDPPLVHNTKVNMGLRPRGLCWHWAEDMEKRLKQENFRTLEVQRAIATPDFLGIDHSTALVSLPGGTIYDGMVLDPWRNGGKLFWSPTLADPRYKWRPQGEVHAEKRRLEVARGKIAVGG
ncbi:hypothetical protein [Defluviimonas salinarum]|uniref:Lipoprotein n=1 Tax=Defluviimonas salinarum TaxID=2992147 RepID=A0ABT3J561_9RHOB|nr:hypothetical protein [Defluviimonas salinarum]MCW3782802.1 hypothetical protein [Defluviimonas salinarum]